MHRRLMLCSILMLGFGLASPVALADDGACYPKCRTGYFCQQSKCVSLCNPPCPSNQQCSSQGECEALPRSSKRARSTRDNYFGLFGGYRPAINDEAFSVGELRLEFGSRYGGMQIGPAFGDGVTSLRTALFGKVPFRIMRAIPFYIVPKVGIGYTYSWLDDANETTLQDVFICPAVRMRYNVIPRVALFLTLIEVEINFLRLMGNKVTDVKRQDVVPINWGFSAGVAFLY